MDIPATTSNIILEESKKLKNIGLIIIWLELVTIIWVVDSLFVTSRWDSISVLEYGIKFSSLLLALGILFLQYVYRVTLPKNDSNVIAFKQEKYEKPTLLRVLLAIQIIVFLYGAYSTSAWSQLYFINLFKLGSFRDIFNLIVFFALHIAIITNIVFLVKLAQVNVLITNNYPEEIVRSKLSSSYKYAAVFCIATLALLLFRLIPKIPSIVADISHLISSAQLLLLIYLATMVLIILLLSAIFLLFQRKKIVEMINLYKWLIAFLTIELYIATGIAEGGIRTLLEFPTIIVPIILSIIFEGLLLGTLIHIYTYTTLRNRCTFLDDAVKTLQKAYAGNVFFTRIFGKVDDENNEPAKVYFRFTVEKCDMQGDIHTYKGEAFLGWIMGDFFPPVQPNNSLMRYKEIELFEKHETTSVKIISDNALNYAYIWILGTAPEARGKGLAKMLIEKILDQMHKANVEECWLSTEDSSNAEYYKKFGFKLFTEQVSELGVTTYIMMNKLSNRVLTI